MQFSLIASNDISQSKVYSVTPKQALRQRSKALHLESLCKYRVIKLT